MVPKILFEVNGLVNEFCHLSVLYADCLSMELATGMLGNKAYASSNSNLRDEAVLQNLQRTPSSPHIWYGFARDLMRTEDLEKLVSYWKGREPQTDVFLSILSKGSAQWEEIWGRVRVRMGEYKEKFQAVWSPIGDSVLARLSELSKSEWADDEIRVHFVDCLNGGFAWQDTVAFAMLPDIEIQKKFLAHELSELITPSRLVEKELGRAGLETGIAHTVVDMIAYFSVKDFIAEPSDPTIKRKGVVPNRNYYPKVDELLPIFDSYCQNPSKYQDFSFLVEDIVDRLRTS